MARPRPTCSTASARALMLTDVEREHLFLLGLGRPPEVRYQAAEGVTPRLQRVLDALELSLGLVKTSTWDIVAWNRAAAAVFIDYASLAPGERNILRLLFCNSGVRAKMPNWESDARFAVAAFRLEAARAGASETSQSARRRPLPVKSCVRSDVGRQRRAAPTARASKRSNTRSPARSRLTIRPSRSTAGRISGW